MSNDDLDLFANEPEFGAFEDAQNYMEQYVADNALPDTFKFELRKLIDGETVSVIFMGGADEPFKFSQHSCTPVSAGQQFKEKVLCAGQNCPLCTANALGDRKNPAIGRATPYMAFSVYSTRKIAIPPKGSSAKSEPVRLNAKGQYIKAHPQTKKAMVLQGAPEYLPGTTFEDEGVKVWMGSALEGTSNCSEIMSLIATLRNRCACKKTVGDGESVSAAEVRIDGCKCAKCGATLGLQSRGRLVTCAACQHHGLPVDRLVCTANCGNPQRLSLRNGYVKITRVGGDKDTKYRFEFFQNALKDSHKLAMTEKDPTTGKAQLKKLPIKEMYTPKMTDLVRQLNARGFDATGKPVQGGSVISSGYNPNSGNEQPFSPPPAADDDLPF